MGRHVGFTEVHGDVATGDESGGLILVIRVKQHATLADWVDAHCLAGIGKINHAPGRGTVGDSPGSRANRAGEVVGHFMASRRVKRANVEQFVEGFLG